MNYDKIRHVDLEKASNKIFDLRPKHIDLRTANADFSE